MPNVKCQDCGKKEAKTRRFKRGRDKVSLCDPCWEHISGVLSDMDTPWYKQEGLVEKLVVGTTTALVLVIIAAALFGYAVGS